MLDSFGSSASTRTKAGTHFGPRSGWLREELVEGGGVEGRAVPQLEADHHPVADRVVGHGVDRDRADVGVAADDRLDRPGREVLAVDPQPVVRPAGEVEPAVGVAVGEVARPVGAVAEALVRWPPRCGSSPRSPTSAAVSTISPTASSRFVTRPPSSKTAGGHSSPVSGSSTFTESSAMPSAPGRHRRVAADDDHALGRAVAVADVAAEAAGELLDVVLGGLVADRQPQRDVGVVGRLGHAEHVVEDLAGVGEEGRAEGRGCRARVPDAENRLRVAIGTPACTADAQPVNSEAEWKNGSGA